MFSLAGKRDTLSKPGRYKHLYLFQLYLAQKPQYCHCEPSRRMVWQSVPFTDGNGTGLLYLNPPTSSSRTPLCSRPNPKDLPSRSLCRSDSSAKSHASLPTFRGAFALRAKEERRAMIYYYPTHLVVADAALLAAKSKGLALSLTLSLRLFREKSRFATNFSRYTSLA